MVGDTKNTSKAPQGEQQGLHVLGRGRKPRTDIAFLMHTFVFQASFCWFWGLFFLTGLEKTRLPISNSNPCLGLPKPDTINTSKASQGEQQGLHFPGRGRKPRTDIVFWTHTFVFQSFLLVLGFFFLKGVGKTRLPAPRAAATIVISSVPAPGGPGVAAAAATGRGRGACCPLPAATDRGRGACCPLPAGTAAAAAAAAAAAVGSCEIFGVI